jgi:hypothetical protein
MSISEPVKEFEGLLDRPENESMILFLKQYQPSAHADMVELLVKSTELLPNVHFYCPDTDNHAYYLAHTGNGVMFAAAIGLSALIFRVPKSALSGALVKGGEILKELGDNWVSFNPFWPEREHVNNKLKDSQLQEYQHMCKLAYHNALSLDEPVK